MQLAVGDYLEVLGFQDSGASLSVLEMFDNSPSFLSVKWTGKN
ncbi:hypothetical protein [Nonomuraea roseola]|uniref:Uncharacterized protein n=1 Tax=Nonomuraea roseola TaxID=46179 RepID=A0ABV5PW10_9ACTN